METMVVYVDIQGGLNPSYTLDWYEYSAFSQEFS